MQNSPFVSGDGGIVINEAGLVRRGKGSRQEVGVRISDGGGRVFDEAFVVSVDEGYLFHLWCGVYSLFHQIR